MFDLRSVDLGKLNSLTKYPSIHTYHGLDPKNGNLTEAVTRFAGPVVGTEKVDGTNARIILLPDDSYVLGSREELLYARGDLIGNPAQGIVAALRGIAEGLVGVDQPRVCYLEVYGGTVGKAAKQYTGVREVGHRLFDVATFPNVDELLALPPERISAWREDGGQHFLPEDELAEVAARHRLPLVPRLFTVDGGELPETVAETAAWLAERLPRTLVALDDTAGGTGEGIVLRGPDRATIAKARFDDYTRTLRRRRP